MTPHCVSLMVLVGFSDFTNAIVHITLSKVLKVYGALVSNDAQDCWSLVGVNREENLAAVIKASFMKLNWSTMNFRRTGERFSDKGKVLPLIQTRGSAGDPTKASYYDILVSCMAKHPFVSGEKKSADVDKYYVPSEGETKELVSRAMSTYDYWDEGCHKKDMTEWKGIGRWKGFESDGTPSHGVSWNLYPFDAAANIIMPPVAQVTQEGGSQEEEDSGSESEEEEEEEEEHVDHNNSQGSEEVEEVIDDQDSDAGDSEEEMEEELEEDEDELNRQFEQVRIADAEAKRIRLEVQRARENSEPFGPEFNTRRRG